MTGIEDIDLWFDGNVLEPFWDHFALEQPFRHLGNRVSTVFSTRYLIIANIYIFCRLKLNLLYSLWRNYIGFHLRFWEAFTTTSDILAHTKTVL